MAGTTTKKKTAAKKAPAKSRTTKAKAATKKKAPAKKATAKKPTKAVAKKTTAKKGAKAAPKKRKGAWKSRAVLRMVEPGSQVECELCGERVKFQAKMRHQQAICNIYEKGKWVRVVHYHYPCYQEAKEPYGPVED